MRPPAASRVGSSALRRTATTAAHSFIHWLRHFHFLLSDFFLWMLPKTLRIEWTRFIIMTMQFCRLSYGLPKVVHRLAYEIRMQMSAGQMARMEI